MKPALPLTRKRTQYGMTIWRLPERPSRSGIYFQARPHYALAPRHWTAEQVWQRGLVFLSYEDALVGLGRIATYLIAAPQSVGEYVALQHGYGLRTAKEWQEPAAAAAEGGAPAAAEPSEPPVIDQAFFDAFRWCSKCGTQHHPSNTQCDGLATWALRTRQGSIIERGLTRGDAEDQARNFEQATGERVDLVREHQQLQGGGK